MPRGMRPLLPQRLPSQAEDCSHCRKDREERGREGGPAAWTQSPFWNRRRWRLLSAHGVPGLEAALTLGPQPRPTRPHCPISREQSMVLHMVLWALQVVVVTQLDTLVGSGLL